MASSLRTGTRVAAWTMVLSMVLAATPVGVGWASDSSDATTGGNGQTTGSCGAFFVLGAIVLGAKTCSFTLNVAPSAVGQELFWDNLLEPAVSFEWTTDAEARSPSANDQVPFTKHWQGIGLTQNPSVPQLIAVITPDRVGLWTFAATYTPSMAPGTPIESPDTGFWQVKACLDPPGPDPITGEDGACILTTPDPPH